MMLNLQNVAATEHIKREMYNVCRFYSRNAHIAEELVFVMCDFSISVAQSALQKIHL